jgi:uncharacterized protein (TIGR02271 family)
MRQTFFLLAVLLLLNGCANRTQTTSRTIQTSEQLAQESSALDRGGGMTSEERTGQGASTIAQGSAITGERGTVETLNQASLELRREELVVGKRDVSNGGVLLRTIIQTNTVNQPVELRREEYVLERIPADQIQDKEALARGTADAFQGREIYIPLMREEAVASKRALATEQVRLAKRVETDRVTVTRPVRAEDVEIVKVAGQPPGQAGVLPDTAIASSAVAPEAAPGEGLILEREELIVGKREVENGGVRLRKIVRTQEASQPVDLQREEYNIDRVPLDNRIAQNADFTPREIRAALMRQEPVAGVRDYVAEVIRVRKVMETDNQVVTANLRQETLEIIKNPEGIENAMGTTSGSTVSGATAMSESGGATRTETVTQEETGGDLNISESVRAFLSERAWTKGPPPWQVDETYLRKGIDVRTPRNVPQSQLPEVSDLGDNIAPFEVATANGVVTIRGTVGSEAEKGYIGQQVAAIPGVRSVNNELEITRRIAPETRRGAGAETLNNRDF